VDGKRIPAATGCSVFVPRGTAHAFRNVGTTAGRMLVPCSQQGWTTSSPNSRIPRTNRGNPTCRSRYPSHGDTDSNCSVRHWMTD
jgi:hypothetical protein